MLIVKTNLKEVPGKGIGLFAAETMPAGTIWHIDEYEFDRIYSGDFVKAHNLNEFFDTYAEYNESNDTFYLCSDNARFVNHSDLPNTYYDQKGKCCKTRINITVGQEITCDYRATCDHAKEKLSFEVL